MKRPKMPWWAKIMSSLMSNSIYLLINKVFLYNSADEYVGGSVNSLPFLCTV